MAGQIEVRAELVDQSAFLCILVFFLTSFLSSGNSQNRELISGIWATGRKASTHNRPPKPPKVDLDGLTHELRAAGKSPAKGPETGEAHDRPIR